MLSTRDHISFKDTKMLKVKGCLNIYHGNNHQKRAGVALLMLDKIDFKTNMLTRDMGMPAPGAGSV